jgi:hypothetical protein
MACIASLRLEVCYLSLGCWAGELVLRLFNPTVILRRELSGSSARLSSKLEQVTLYPSTQVVDDRSTAIPPLFTNKSSYQAARHANRSNVQRSHFSNLIYQPTA